MANVLEQNRPNAKVNLIPPPTSMKPSTNRQCAMALSLHFEFGQTFFSQMNRQIVTISYICMTSIFLNKASVKNIELQKKMFFHFGY